MKLNSSFILYAGFLIYYYPYIRDIQQNKLLSVSLIYNKTNYYPYIRDIQQNKLLSVYPGYTTKQIAIRIWDIQQNKLFILQKFKRIYVTNSPNIIEFKELRLNFPI